MNVAIIGATGFVGSHLADAIQRAGHRLSVLVRPGSEHKLTGRDHFRVTSGDLDSAGALATTLADCDAVIYCIGILREFPRRGITFEKTQYRGVVDTIAAARQAGVRRLLLMSANGVRIPGTPYQETKKRAEDRAFGSGLDVTVFRPSVIFGDPRGRMEIGTQLYRDLVRPPVPALGFFTGTKPSTGPILMSPVHIDDVADAFCAALGDVQTIGRAIELGGPDVLSWTEMVRRVAAAVGKRKLVLPFPVSVMKLAATCLDWLPIFPVTRDQLTMLAEGNTADADALQSLIGRDARRFDAAALSYLRNP